MNALYPVIITAGCLGWLSSKSQRIDHEKEVLVRDKKIDELKKELHRERRKYSAFVTSSDFIIENLKSDVQALRDEIKEVEELAEARIGVVREKTISDAISELEKLQFVDTSEAD